MGGLNHKGTKDTKEEKIKEESIFSLCRGSAKGKSFTPKGGGHSRLFGQDWGMKRIVWLCQEVRSHFHSGMMLMVFPF